MLVSSKAFDTDALGIANKYRIYCVKAKKKEYEFVGDISREDLDNCESSDY